MITKLRHVGNLRCRAFGYFFNRQTTSLHYWKTLGNILIQTYLPGLPKVMSRLFSFFTNNTARNCTVLPGK